jgi:hypothetical protein
MLSATYKIACWREVYNRADTRTYGQAYYTHGAET